MQKLENAVLNAGQIRASRTAKKRRKPHKH
jgi:hypothetical protein